MTFPDTTLFTSTLTSGWTLPTSVTFTWISATSALPTFTGSFASGFLPVAFMATNVMTIATARTMIEQAVIVFQAADASGACAIVTMFGNGDGTFRAPVKTPTARCGSPTPLSPIAAGDLDRDGNVDIVVSRYDRLIDVYRGNRDGSFTL